MLTGEKRSPQVDFSKIPSHVAIVGSRSFDETKVMRRAFRRAVGKLVKQLPETTMIVSGGAKGIDFYAKQAAEYYNRPYKEFPPDMREKSPWRYVKRNRDLVDYVKEKGGMVIAFGDVAHMRGTNITTSYAKQKNVPCLVYTFSTFPLRTVGVEQFGCDVIL